MKNLTINSLLSVLLLLSTQISWAQLKTIDSYRLDISNIKTTNIIFPENIISVDRGTSDILVQKAKGVENILQVKSASDSLVETNLTVVTADGKLNSFLVSYAEHPLSLNISLRHQSQPSGIFLSPENLNLGDIKAQALAAKTDRKRLRGIKDKDYGIVLQMDGLFIKEEVLYCRLNITNRTNINYNIDQLRFFINDRRKAKRTATQEIEVTPIYIADDTNKVTANNHNVFVFALPKFTIPDKKYLMIQLMEKNGGRHLELRIKNKTIIGAKTL